MDILQKNILEVKDLAKDYPGFHLKMDLAVPAGSIMGLVGPNGAWKSTTPRLILGLAHPDSGSIQVLGCSDLNKAPALREDIGVVYPAEGTSAVPDGSALILGAPHPDNARAFLEFVQSTDVQALVVSDFARRSVRQDVADREELPTEEEMGIFDYPVDWASALKEEFLTRWADYTGEGAP